MTALLPFWRQIVPQSEFICHQFLVFPDRTCCSIEDDVSLETVNNYLHPDNIEAKSIYFIYYADVKIVLAELTQPPYGFKKLDTYSNYEDLVCITFYDSPYSLTQDLSLSRIPLSLEQYYEKLFQGKTALGLIKGGLTIKHLDIPWYVIYSGLKDIDDMCSQMKNLTL